MPAYVNLAFGNCLKSPTFQHSGPFGALEERINIHVNHGITAAPRVLVIQPGSSQTFRFLQNNEWNSFELQTNCCTCACKNNQKFSINFREGEVVYLSCSSFERISVILKNVKTSLCDDGPVLKIHDKRLYHTTE